MKELTIKINITIKTLKSESLVKKSVEARGPSARKKTSKMLVHTNAQKKH
jgi:hypothetical protein